MEDKNKSGHYEELWKVSKSKKGMEAIDTYEYFHSIEEALSVDILKAGQSNNEALDSSFKSSINLESFMKSL